MDSLKINKKVACIILAAGAGRRFGMPKWQAEYGGKTFLELIIEKVNNAGIYDIACVIRKDSVPNIKKIKYTVNPTPELGMFSSLFYGINVFPDKLGYVIIPVDHPFFEYETLIKLCSSFKNQGFCNIARPVYKSRPGHPIVIPGTLAKHIPIGDYDGGLKKFIEDADVPLKNVNVYDRGILMNINTVNDISV